MAQTHTGKCLCGAVSYTAKIKGDGSGACHCSMCRRWSGGPLMAIDVGTDITWNDEANITVFRSSEWAERGFCRNCGSNLFYRLVGTGDIHLATGTLDDVSELKLTNQVFIDEKPDFYSFSQKTKDLTGPELFAMFAPDEGD